MTTKSKNPSQNQHRQPQPHPKPQTTLTSNTSAVWTFGYPQCINKKESRLVCLHNECEKYPFFCSSCEDESCEHEHQHKDKISSIGFKELIKRLITERKAPEQLEKCVDAYKNQLQQLLKTVTEFVKSETNSVDEVLKKSSQVEPQDEKVIQRLKDKKYQEIKGKQLDGVWSRVAPTEHKKKLEKEMIEFIDSKRVEVEGMTVHFSEGLKTESDKEEIKKESKEQKPSSQLSKDSKPPTK